ncbi:PREDICTED: prefoldin subunit 2-like [Branchiostoma belcheri]|uniref:Prefoldin subunit 2 n=1 Tax=Branchiostoma belcheri TaxID=7741 RepID=A0A6P4YFG8_BRABE|nr:PREDICTED: prefoldin subunit 2-like [Branchiostoma belcheri]KAI8488731.1 Prefoldin subunit 2 [Branchiostoma belcheri]
MASGDSTAAKVGNKQVKVSQEQVVAGFNQLREQQRAVASKCSELEMELNEHRLVVETLKDVDGDRKCFRMVGGVLVERTVKEVLPALEHNMEQLSKLIESLNAQVVAKGEELTKYREKYNIKIKGEDETPKGTESSGGGKEKSGTQGILVS